MDNVYSILTIILFVSPFVLGVGAFGAHWFVEKFYENSEK